MDSYTPHAVWRSFVVPFGVAALALTLACEPFTLPSQPSDAGAVSEGTSRDLQPGAGDGAGPSDGGGSDGRVGPRDGGGGSDRPEPGPDEADGPGGPDVVDPFTAGIGEEAVLAFVNESRASVGLAPFAPDSRLTAAAAAHASFLVRHRDVYDQSGTSAHIEIEGLPGFTGKTFTQRLDAAGYDGRAMAEVVAFKPSSVGAARSWMESLYHRLPLLDPAIDEAGFGELADGARYANVLEMGQSGQPTDAPEFVVWPPRGARDVPSAWDGAEIPQPPAPPAGYPSGPVLTLHATSGALTITGATVAPESTG
ncbi:MAG: CAP domain-containing protein, partial [Myxococcota bacterium]